MKVSLLLITIMSVASAIRNPIRGMTREQLAERRRLAGAPVRYSTFFQFLSLLFLKLFVLVCDTKIGIYMEARARLDVILEQSTVRRYYYWLHHFSCFVSKKQT